MDIFIEKIVAKRKDGKDALLNIGIVLGALILMIVAMNVPVINQMALLVAVGIGYFAFRLITSRNVEFEYVVTNGDLDIDKIVAQRKRKRIFSSSCKNFDIVAKVKSSHYTPQIQSIKNKIEAVSTMAADDVYFITLNYKGEGTVIYFQPDERMLNNFKTFIPRKLMLN